MRADETLEIDGDALRAPTRSRLTRVISTAPSSVAMMKRDRRTASTSSCSCGRASHSSERIWLAQRSKTASMRTRKPSCASASSAARLPNGEPPRPPRSDCSATTASMNSVEPLERIDHRLAQNREAALGEPLELPVQHFVPQLFLAAEVVVEMALATELRATDDVIHRGGGVSAFRDQRRGGVEDLECVGLTS
jgi:hypothetical protein